MLGRGLESLLPQNQGGNPGDDLVFPKKDDHEEEKFFPANPHEDLLPEGHPNPSAEPKSFEPSHSPPATPVSNAAIGFPVADNDMFSPLKQSNAVFHIEVEKIRPNPHQPRRHFEEGALKDLANSIREFGILQPLVVNKKNLEVADGVTTEYELIAGERRLMAAKIAGLPSVPVIVRQVEAGQEMLELAIIENLQRENLNPIESARAFARLQDEFRLTQREIAVRLGKSREVVANTMRLLDLPTAVQDAVAKGAISESHGRLLLAIGDQQVQDRIFQEIMRDNLSTRELRMMVEDSKIRREKRQRRVLDIAPELTSWQDELSSKLGAPVSINNTGKGGKITINFYSQEELTNIISQLGLQVDES